MTGDVFEAEVGRVRALCCDCGSIRKVAANYSGRGSDWDLRRTGEGRNGDPRCTIGLKCEQCRRTTKHAYLRDGDAHADHVEREQAESSQPMLEALWKVRNFGIRVTLSADLVEGGWVEIVERPDARQRYEIRVAPDLTNAQVEACLVWGWRAVLSRNWGEFYTGRTGPWRGIYAQTEPARVRGSFDPC